MAQPSITIAVPYSVAKVTNWCRFWRNMPNSSGSLSDSVRLIASVSNEMPSSGAILKLRRVGARAPHGQDILGSCGRMAAARRAHGAEDLITALVEAEVAGESLEDWEILGFCMLLRSASHETTTHLVGNLLNIFVERPVLWPQ